MSIAAYLSNLLNSSGLVPVTKLNISGTPTGAKFLRDDASWVAPITSGTSVASTSGTSIDFTSIPSGVKRITLMFNGVSTNGTSPIMVQIGSGSFTTSGYASSASNLASSTLATGLFTTGLTLMNSTSATSLWSGFVILTNITGNTWLSSGNIGRSDAAVVASSGGGLALSGALDRIRFTTVGGTDTFDAGSINIMYE